MLPGGMSSDEDDDDYFSVTVLKSEEDKHSSESSQRTPNRKHPVPIDNVSLFHCAAAESDFETMGELLLNGVSIDAANIGQWTALMTACSNGNIEVVRFLLQNGADPNVHKELFTPIMACCTHSYVPEQDRLECLRLLLQKGAAVNARDRYTTSALMHAASNGWELLVMELLSVPGIELDVKDSEGCSALFHAIKNGSKAIVERLLNSGADPCSYNLQKSCSALEYAEFLEKFDIAEVLRSHPKIAAENHPTLRPAKDPSEQEVIRSELSRYLSQLPDENGRGGFKRDVRNVFAGVGYGHLYDRLNPNVGFSEFLSMQDCLEEVGVKLKPVRLKVKEGIHRFHLCPWKKTALPDVENIKSITEKEIIDYIMTVTKHLSILYATLNYMKTRLDANKAEKRFNTVGKQMVNVSIDILASVTQLRRTLVLISKNFESAQQITESDFVGKFADKPKNRLSNSVWIISGTALVSAAIFYYKYH